VHLLGPLDDRIEAHRTLLRGVSAEELRKHPLAYRPKRAKPTDPVPYYGLLREFTFKTEIDGQTVTVPGQALVVLSQSKERLDQTHRQAELHKLQHGLEAIQGKLNQRYYKRREYVSRRIDQLQRGNKAKRLMDVELLGQDGALELRYEVNAEKLAQAQALDGKYLLATTQRQLTADEVLQRSKMRDGVEKRIELFKGPLQVRPIFVQTETRIAGLVFLTLVALLVFSILELELRRANQPQTARAVVEAFGSLRAVYLLFLDGSVLRRAGEPSNYQTRILTLLGFPSPQTYLNVSC
jgi:transposase